MTIPDEKFFHAEVTRRVDFAPDLWMFRVRSGGEFKFVPGQYATLGVETGEKRVERPYSIASSPAEDEIEFFFELVPEGALTPLLYKLQPGDQLLMRKVPQGQVLARYAEWADESSADLDGDGRGSVCELRALAEQGVERRTIRRDAQTLLAEWGEPAVGVWLPR